MTTTAAPRTDVVGAEDRLTAGLAALGLVASNLARSRLIGYLRLLERWNATYNLTSIRGFDDMVVAHALDSLAIVPMIDAFATSGSVVDVGSGAGLPGIPLAILRPALSITTIDAVAKKIAFQRHAIASLELANVDPVHGRVEALTLSKMPDLIVARAFAPLGELLRSIDSIAGPETRVLAMKGPSAASELEGLPARWAIPEVRDLDVPFLGARRSVILVAPA